MRGAFNDWGNPSPTDEFLFINFGAGIYQAEFEMTAGEYNYKVADAGWSVERATSPDDVLQVGDSQGLVDPGPGGPEGVVNVPSDGCYNFTIDFSDAENPVITMTEVILDGDGGGGGPPATCGLTDQGNDNSEALGQNIFMRGAFNDWGNPSPTDEFLFINFGAGIYQAEFEMTAGEYNYKVADAGWTVERATAPDDVLQVGDSQGLVDPGPGGPEGVVNVPSDGCYNFTIDFSDPENPVMTMTEVDLSGGGPPGGGKETCGLADQGNDNSDAFGANMFMRGAFNDWGNPSPTNEFLFINFGAGFYQAEFEMTAGEYN
jgi:pullulanase